jgi:hypothetical protein
LGSDRTREPPRSDAGEQVDAQRPRGPDLERFKVLLASTRNAGPEELRAVAGTINDLLVAMRSPENDHAEGAAILKQLELRSFDDLVDGRGRNCRKEAVETLMVMGFPHALAISPDDFAFARRYARAPEDAVEDEDHPDHDGWRGHMSLSRQLCAGLVVTGNAVQAVSFFTAPRLGPGTVALGLAASVFSVGAALFLATRKLNPDTQAVPLTALALGTGFNLFASLAANFTTSIWGSIANVLGLAVALVWQDKEPRRHWTDGD